MWQEKDPDPYIWLLDPDDQKHADPVPDPDPQHWYRIYIAVIREINKLF
jgi:hypothetical protein